MYVEFVLLLAPKSWAHVLENIVKGVIRKSYLYGVSWEDFRHEGSVKYCCDPEDLGF